MKERRRRKILVVIGTLAHMGGAERQAVHLMEYLTEKTECDVELLAFEDGLLIRTAVERLGVKIHAHPYYFRWPKRKRIASLARLAARIKFQVKPDAILPFVGIHSKAIAQIGRYTGAKFYWWNQQDEGRDLFGTAEEKRILHRLSCITSNSTIGRDFLAATYDINPSRIRVYNNGTPLPREVSRCDVFRERIGVGNRPMITMLANVTPFKDHATLLKAFQIVLKETAANPVLLLAGHLRDDAHLQSLKTLAFDLGLSSESVRFLGPVSEVDLLLRGSDVVAHSSLLEGCPNAVCEAMAYGLPVVATDIPGCRQALGDDAGCSLVSPSNPTAFAVSLIQMLNDEGLRAAAGRANRERIRSEFSLDGMNDFFRQQIEDGLGCSLN